MITKLSLRPWIARSYLKSRNCNLAFRLLKPETVTFCNISFISAEKKYGIVVPLMMWVGWAPIYSVSYAYITHFLFADSFMIQDEI